MTPRTALLTGAGSERGIGRSLAHRLAADGWSLALLDRDADGLAATVASLADTRVGAWTVDIRDEHAVDRAIGDIEATMPPVAALVNIAGISDPTSFLDYDADRWRRLIDVNLTGTFVVTHRVVPGMVARGYGRIVCLGSTAAQSGGGNYSTTAYAASKAGIEGLVRGLARELAPVGVTVNCVAPALIDTDIMGGPITHERLPGFVGAVPVGRLGRADEVCALIEFLIGDEAGFITGATYNINGGVRIG